MPEAALHKDIILKRDANLSDTLNHLERIVNDYSYQVADLAHELNGIDIEDTSRNVWTWIKNNIRYKKDIDGIEQLRRPARIIADGKGDCDCMTILARCLLKENGIKNASKTVAYPEKDNHGKHLKNIFGQYKSGDYSHIYALSYDKNKTFVIDCVPEIPQFNYEHQPITRFLITPENMELHELAGIEESVLDAIGSDDFDQELSGNDLSPEMHSAYETQILGSLALASSGKVIGKAEFTTNVIRADVTRQMQVLKDDKSQNGAISQVLNIDREIDVFEQVLNSKDFETALLQAAKSSSQFKDYFGAMAQNLPQFNLNGIDDDEVVYLSQLSGTTYQELYEQRLGKISLNKFGKKVFGKGGVISKGLKTVMKISPVTVAMRGAALLLVKTNTMDIADKLAIGYMSESQAKQNGYDSATWQKFVKARQNLEKKWEGFGGRSDGLKKAVVTSKTGKSAGLSGELGIAVAAALTAAAPFIAAVKSIFGGLSLKKGSDKEKQSSNNTPASTNTSTGENLPDNYGNSNLPETENEGEETKIQKVYGWVKEHKAISIGSLIGVIGLILVLWYVLTPKKKAAAKKKKNRTLNGAQGRKTATCRCKTILSTRKSRSRALRAGKPRTAKKALSGIPTKRRTPAKKAVSTSKTGNALKLLHLRARAIRAKYPKMKYTTAMKQAAIK